MSEEPFDLSRIKNVQVLLDHFGECPSFHDADIKTIHLDRGITDPDNNVYEDPTIVMELDVVDWNKWVNKQEPFQHWKHTVLVTLKFVFHEGIKLSYFGPDNGIDGLGVELVKPEPWDCYKVSFWNHGSEEPFIEFNCNEIEVVSVKPKS